jgi:hypothetical protein
VQRQSCSIAADVVVRDCHERPIFALRDGFLLREGVTVFDQEFIIARDWKSRKDPLFVGHGIVSGGFWNLRKQLPFLFRELLEPIIASHVW